MSFQIYLDSVKAKTGKTVADFRTLADEKQLTKHGEIVKWLKEDFGLGHGHATAVAAALLNADHFKTLKLEKVNAVFSGKKAAWKSIYDALWAAVQGFGDDVDLAPHRLLCKPRPWTEAQQVRHCAARSWSHRHRPQAQGCRRHRPF